MAYKRKGNWKVKSKEEKQKELDDLIDLSNKKIEQYQTNPEDMIEFGRFMSKIHNYSPLNLSLIDEQFEGAIAVSSYEGWKKLGYQVQRGEKGIGIYAHAPVTIFKDKNGEEKTLREATQEEKQLIENGILSTKKIKHFKKGYVYDVSQTNASEADLPKMFPNRVWNFEINGEASINQLEKGVSSVAESLNISIKDMNDTHLGELGSVRGAFIQYINGEEEISLNSRNSRTQNLTTSIHELAHRRLHKKTEEGSKYSTPVKEFQAEMTSFIVCNNYGIDTSDFTIPYISSWTKNNEKIEKQMFRQVMQEVRQASMEFIDLIDKSIIEERKIENGIVQEESKTEEAENAQKNSFTSMNSKEVNNLTQLFDNKIFDGKDFEKFSKDDLKGTIFTNCTFDKIRMDNSDFSNTKFIDCNFNFADMKNSNFKNATFENVGMVGGSLKNCNLEEATLNNVSISSTNLSNVDLKNTMITDLELNEIKIGQSIRNLESVNVIKGDKAALIQNLSKDNFNTKFIPGELDLQYKNYYSKIEDDPNRELYGSYLEGMVDFYQKKYGNETIEIEYHGSDITATVGENYVSYYSDTKQFDVCDIYGVTAENTSLDKYDRLLLDRNPENCDYVEGFLSESIKAYGIEQNSSNVIKELTTDIPLRDKVILESSNNLKEQNVIGNPKVAWHEEVTRQSEIDSIAKICNHESIDDFYKNHKNEIENTITDFTKLTGIDFRKGTTKENYNEKTGTLAYKLVSTKLKTDIENDSFDIPGLDISIGNNQQKSFEME